MQVQQKKSFIQSFGGLNFIHDILSKNKFPSWVHTHLGNRSRNTTYSYSDILSQLFYTAVIGGEVLDDNITLKEQLQDHPHLKIASPDTIEYSFKELQQATCIQTSTTGAVHAINEHKGFNQLLTALCSQPGLLTDSQNCLLDYDGHIVENTKKDNAYTYKKTEGYYPVICSISKMPVYMQNRKGNTPESYNQLQIIQNAIANCANNNIKITAFRSDACCYERETIQYLESQDITFYIRAQSSQRLTDALDDEPEWESVMIGHKKVEVCSIEEPVLGDEKYRRIVAYRYQVKGQLQLGENKGYRYYAIITSDTEKTPLQVIEHYNQRGCDGEHHFKELDYDFNWNKLPFDTFEMNTVYMYAMTVAYLLYNITKQILSSKIGFVERNMRLKRFILHFVTLPAKWIKSGRRYILKIFTTKNYYPLFAT